MNISGLTPGAGVKLSTSEKLYDKYIFSSQVVDILDDNRIILASPMKITEFVFVPLDARVWILFLDEVHGLMVYEGKVLSKQNANNIPVLIVQITDNPQKIQRRKYFRVSCVLDALYCVIKEDQATEEKPLYKEAFTKNISACGICLVVKEKIEKNTLLNLSIKLPNLSEKIISCKVVRSNIIEGFAPIRYELGIDFIELNQHYRNELVHYILELQRQLLKKQLL